MSVIVSIETLELEVDPGSSRDVLVRIRNTGDIVDRFSATIVGDSASWASVTPAAVNLYPGAEELVRVSFAPPRKSVPKAGRYVYGVFVKSSEHPEDAITEEAAVTVLPFTATTAELVPQTSRGSGRVKHEVSVRNAGNVEVEAEIAPSDPDRLLRFETKPDRLLLEPGGSGLARISVAPVETFLNGPPQSRQFGVTVTSSGQEPFELRGALLQSARLPSWLPRAVAGLAVAGAIAIVLFATGTFPPRPPASASPSSSEIAQASPTPSPSAQASPSASESPTEPPSVPPSIPPTAPPTTVLGEFELAPVPDPALTNGALLADPACDLNPGAPCYETAIATLTTMAGELGAAYGGDGVVNRDNKVGDVLTVPLIVDREGPFSWTTQDGAATGDTRYVVVDLAPLIASEPGFAYAVVQRSAGDTPAARFLVNDELAHALLETIYDVNDQMVDPGPVRSLPPIFEPFDPGQLDWDFDFNQP